MQKLDTDEQWGRVSELRSPRIFDKYYYVLKICNHADLMPAIDSFYRHVARDAQEIYKISGGGDGDERMRSESIPICC